jgi:hypothetical protein
MMKAQPLHLFKIALAALIAYPAFVLAAPPTTTPPATSPYFTDTVNSYVQDQVSQDMSGLNDLLCFMGAMAPNLMVNSGDYIALVDFDSCESSGSGGKSSNTGVNYMSVQVNSSRTSNSSPMQVKIWLDMNQGATTRTIPIYASASQAPSKALPYGVFRMDYCVQTGSSACDTQMGYIDASRSGLAYYTLQQENDGTFNELALQLSSSSSTNSGSGIVVKNNNTAGSLVTTATLFAYSPDYFYRDDGSNLTSGQCFNRSTKYADESAWRYGLYDVATGEQFIHPSGFPIEYLHTDGVTYNGYISYYGISMPVDAPNAAQIYQITYGTNPPTKTPYKLLQAGGKLTKYTTNTKTLSELHKVTFWYYAQIDVGAVMTAGSQYELYWDNTAGVSGTGSFMVSGKQGANGNMEPYATPQLVDNAAMVIANPSGLRGWSQLAGGEFTIKASDFTQLAATTSATPVITQTQDVVYPKDFQALTCINGCPNSSGVDVNPVTYNPITGLIADVLSGSLVPYTLDITSGNMIHSSGPVVSTVSQFTSGKLLDDAGMSAINTAKCGGPCTSYNQDDVNLAASYYVWETGPNSYNQMSFLYTGTDTTNTVLFYPPLPVSFVVPNTSKYGTLAGSTVSLQYGEFGSLWGIPNKCIDITNNTDCVFGGGTPTSSGNQRWTPNFSIPFSLTEGYVTAGITQGTLVTQGTQFWVKALDKEVRLAKVNNNICTALGLNDAVRITKLATSADWLDPSSKVGTKTVLNPMPAPRVIHGVKQY